MYNNIFIVYIVYYIFSNIYIYIYIKYKNFKEVLYLQKFNAIKLAIQLTSV